MHGIVSCRVGGAEPPGGRGGFGLGGRGVAPLLVVALVVVSCVALTVASAPRAETARPRATVIGDSVMTALIWHEDALSILEKGIDLQVDVAVCRRLVGESCPYEGARAPTLLDVVHALGPRLGATVVVVVGYNEPESLFSQAVEESVSALLGAGVTRILWVTLAEATPAYAAMNDELIALEPRYPAMTIVDWDGASRDHRDWFQTDGIHLTEAGGIGMAKLLRDALDGCEAVSPNHSVATVAPVAGPAGPLPGAPYDSAYPVRLIAQGSGVAPYRSSVGATSEETQLDRRTELGYRVEDRSCWLGAPLSGS
jgi:hypothetical protein